MESTYTTQDARLKLELAGATATVEKLIGRPLGKNLYEEVFNCPQSYKTYYDIYGSSTGGTYSEAKVAFVQLKTFPVDTAEAFKVYYDPAGVFGEDTLLEATQYSLNPATGVLNLIGGFPAVLRSLKVHYHAGYELVPNPDDATDISLPDLPADIQQAVLYQTLHTHDKFNDNGGINSTSAPNCGKGKPSMYANTEGMSSEMLAIVAQYKKPRVAFI